MKGRLLALALGIGVATGTSACAYRSAQEARESATLRTFVTVENQAFLNANIYVIAGGQRQRLGSASGVGGKQTFEIPRNIIFGPTTLSFLVDFVGSQRTPMSEAITVTPGDTVMLTIPPM